MMTSIICFLYNMMSFFILKEQQSIQASNKVIHSFLSIFFSFFDIFSKLQLIVYSGIQLFFSYSAYTDTMPINSKDNC